jgi:hypothetical protein
MAILLDMIITLDHCFTGVVYIITILIVKETIVAQEQTPVMVEKIVGTQAEELSKARITVEQ